MCLLELASFPFGKFLLTHRAYHDTQVVVSNPCSRPASKNHFITDLLRMPKKERSRRKIGKTWPIEFLHQRHVISSVLTLFELSYFFSAPLHDIAGGGMGPTKSLLSFYRICKGEVLLGSERKDEIWE